MPLLNVCAFAEGSGSGGGGGVGWGGAVILKNQLRDPETVVLPMDTQWPFSVKQSGMALFLACFGGLTYYLPLLC